jgi:hypothetical protein
VLYVLASRLAGIPASVRTKDSGRALAALAALALVVSPVGLAGRAAVASGIVIGCALLGYRRFGARLRAGRLNTLATPSA